MHRDRHTWLRAVICFTFILGANTRAEVADSSSAGFTVKNTVQVAGAPGRAYERLVTGIGRWWSSDHTFSGDAANLSLDAKAGGLFSEKLRSGGTVRHMTVVYADPGVMLRLEGGLGPLQSMAAAGSMTFAFTKVDSSTSIEMIYTVGGYYPAGMAKLAGIVDTVLRDQLTRFKNYADHGTP